MRKIYIVPNLVTTANLFCGFYSMIASIHQEFVPAAWAILAAAIFDALDGRVARMAKATSEFGVQYDSMSDLVSFGAAPGILLYQWALEPYGRLGWLAAFLFTACGALRLARFNVSAGKISSSFFQGLPIPMAAGVVATYIIFNQTLGWPADGSMFSRELVALIFTFGLASLMVSTVPFPSFKEVNWRSRATFGYLMVGVLAMILIAVKPEITLFLVLVTYVALSLVYAVFRLIKGPSRATQQSHGHAEESRL
ncbi:MAG: CDP-diacylglycerol--serine O-phosphatidyltransferase [Methylotenera sp.]|nr:CDP-diacylglycerol--serine O-phosphatidyltransferase [Oligoflexia bacterium]